MDDPAEWRLSVPTELISEICLHPFDFFKHVPEAWLAEYCLRLPEALARVVPLPQFPVCRTHIAQVSALPLDITNPSSYSGISLYSEVLISNLRKLASFASSR